jgi:hypothetical protein
MLAQPYAVEVFLFESLRVLFVSLCQYNYWHLIAIAHIFLQVKILLDLKQEYKAITGEEFGAPKKTEAPADGEIGDPVQYAMLAFLPKAA